MKIFCEFEILHKCDNIIFTTIDMLYLCLVNGPVFWLYTSKIIKQKYRHISGSLNLVFQIVEKGHGKLIIKS